jgi:hypothetical protein
MTAEVAILNKIGVALAADSTVTIRVKWFQPMNRLDRKTRAQILHLLCEGQSIRAVTRLTGGQQEHGREVAC